MKNLFKRLKKLEPPPAMERIVIRNYYGDEDLPKTDEFYKETTRIETDAVTIINYIEKNK
jgi:hypothetical protein